MKRLNFLKEYAGPMLLTLLLTVLRGAERIDLSDFESIMVVLSVYAISYLQKISEKKNVNITIERLIGDKEVLDSKGTVEHLNQALKEAIKNGQGL